MLNFRSAVLKPDSMFFMSTPSLLLGSSFSHSVNSWYVFSMSSSGQAIWRRNMVTKRFFWEANSCCWLSLKSVSALDCKKFHNIKENKKFYDEHDIQSLWQSCGFTDDTKLLSWTWHYCPSNVSTYRVKLTRTTHIINYIIHWCISVHNFC